VLHGFGVTEVESHCFRIVFSMARAPEACISAWSFAAQSVAMQQAPLVLFPVINKLTSVE
jgi:hypothetical protein